MLFAQQDITYISSATLGEEVEVAQIDEKLEQALALIREGQSFSAAIAAVYNTRGGNKFKRISQELMAVIAKRI